MKRDKIVKQLERVRSQPKPHEDPLVPYRRTVFLVKKSKINWMLELIRLGHGKVVIQYLIIWAIILLAIGLSIFVVIKFILEMVGW